jgi:NADPH2:quinone reductase
MGRVLIRLAVAAGGHVIATVGNAAKAEVARRRGAETTVLYNETDFVAPARDFGDGEGVDVVFDSLGAATFERSLQCLRRRGLMVLYGSNAGPVKCVEPMVLAEHGSLSFIRPRLADYVPDAQAVRERAAALFQAMIEGSLVVEVEEIYDMRDVQEAHAVLESRRNIGKSVLQLAGDASATETRATRSDL